MPKIGNWTKIGETAWMLGRKGKPSVYLSAVHQFIDIGKKRFYGEEKINKKVVKRSKEYKSKDDANSWCIRFMKKHKE